MCLPTYLLLIDLRNGLSLYSISQLYPVVFFVSAVHAQLSKHVKNSTNDTVINWKWELGFRNNASPIYHSNTYIIRDIISVIFRNKTCYYLARLVKVKIVKYWFFRGGWAVLLWEQYKKHTNNLSRFFFLVILGDAWTSLSTILNDKCRGVKINHNPH